MSPDFWRETLETGSSTYRLFKRTFNDLKPGTHETIRFRRRDIACTKVVFKNANRFPPCRKKPSAQNTAGIKSPMLRWVSSKARILTDT